MSPTDPQAFLASEPVSNADTTDRQRLDQAIGLYKELGFSEERAAITLARNGYPSEAIVARFPDVPA
jgi:ribosomal protein S18 acetylase RimI-like enzyme